MGGGRRRDAQRASLNLLPAESTSLLLRVPLVPVGLEGGRSSREGLGFRRRGGGCGRGKVESVTWPVRLRVRMLMPGGGRSQGDGCGQEDVVVVSIDVNWRAGPTTLARRKGQQLSTCATTIVTAILRLIVVAPIRIHQELTMASGAPCVLYPWRYDLVRRRQGHLSL